MMITLLTNFLKASLPLLARSQLASVPGLWLYRKRAPACDRLNASCCSYRSVWYYKTVALLGCCSILKHYVFKFLTSDVIGIDALYTIIMLCWRSQRAAQWRYSLIMRLPFFMPATCTHGLTAALEEKLSRPGSDVALDAQFYEERSRPRCDSLRKIRHVSRQPDADFQRQAALWGVALREPVTAERAGGVYRLAGGR